MVNPRVILVSAVFLGLVGCNTTGSLEQARTDFFATVDGNDEDCEAWLEWCVAEGYPEEACEERSEYCVDGEWVGGDRDESSDPCGPAADVAYQDCLDAGGSEEECREAAAEAYEECEGEN